MIYLDNAATVFPKPPEMLAEMCDLYGRMGVSPGRGSYDAATEAGELVDETRQAVCRFFNADSPERVCFQSNSTDALNTLLLGACRPGDHVVTTRLEHNSVLRPLHTMGSQGHITWDAVPFDENGCVSPGAVADAIRPETRLVIMTHASNVIGTVQPVAGIGEVCRKRGVPFALDVAQSAGVIPVDMQAMNLSAVAFTGHKGLLGPTGIGGLVLRRGYDIGISRFGGTGIESRRLEHTPEYPVRHEAGTLNLMGILGLRAGIRRVETEGAEAIHAREMALWRRLRDGLRDISGITLHYGEDSVCAERTAVLACTVDSMEAEDVGAVLDADFGICVRTGLQCSPLVHQDMGTYETGAVRFSIGPFNTEADIDAAVDAMREITGV